MPTSFAMIMALKWGMPDVHPLIPPFPLNAVSDEELSGSRAGFGIARAFNEDGRAVSELSLASAHPAREAQAQLWWSMVGADHQEGLATEKPPLQPFALNLLSGAHPLSIEHLEITPSGKASVSINFSFGDLRLPSLSRLP